MRPIIASPGPCHPGPCHRSRAEPVAGAPDCLPPVASKHLLAAWELACDAACDARPGPVRRIALTLPHRPDAALIVTDPDAACWVGAIRSAFDPTTQYGLSVCLRVLALADLLTREAWAQRLALVHGEGIRLAPALLREAAEIGLTEDARFDEQDLASRLQTWRRDGR